MEAMEKLSTHLRNRPAELRGMKDKGVKIIGCSAGGFIPEEMIYAAGAVPVRLVRGGEPEPIEASLPYAYRWMCPFIRAQMGYQALAEDPYYQMLDLFISVVSCQHQRRLGDLYHFFTSLKVFKLGIPHFAAAHYALEYYIESLKELKEEIENLTGNEIGDENLREATSLYNRMRELLKDINSLRKAQPPLISSKDFIQLNHASFVADPSLMVDTLHSIHQELKGEIVDIPDQNPQRILLTGPNLAVGDYKVIDLIEKCGAAIVAEEFCEGVRHYWESVEETSGDLLNALGRRYLTRRVPCAFQMPSMKIRVDFIKDLAKEFKVDGVIWYQLKNCETYNIEAFYANEQLREVDMPFLKIESEYDPGETGGMETRIETFVESMKRRQ